MRRVLNDYSLAFFNALLLKSSSLTTSVYVEGTKSSLSQPGYNSLVFWSWLSFFWVFCTGGQQRRVVSMCMISIVFWN